MPHSVTKATNIGLVFLHTLAYYRRALRGIWRYAITRPQWELTPLIPGEHSLKIPPRFRPHGLIVTANTTGVEKALAAWNRPAVNVSAVIPGQRFPRIGADNAAIGVMAADHFLQCGLRHFGYVGPPGQLFASERRAAFCDKLQQAGHRVACFISRGHQEFDPHGLHWDLEALVQPWLRKLTKPVGIFTPSDLWGVQVLMACRRARLRVPEDVAVLGVDNDTVYCEMTRPGLSSVILPSEQIGYEAAALLERLLGGEKPPEEPLLLPPVGIRCRRSSEVLAIDDEEVVAAVRFIREHAHQVLQVEDVLKRIPLGRRTLERRFRKLLGWSIAVEIQRAHFTLARRLLVVTDLPITSVADQAGFSDYRHMTRVFHRLLETTPAAYRSKLRISRSDPP
jgi:LacI family transcriptional regulator